MDRRAQPPANLIQPRPDMKSTPAEPQTHSKTSPDHGDGTRQKAAPAATEHTPPARRG